MGMDKKYICTGCGREFVPRDKRYAKYCSYECSAKHKAELSYEKNKLECIQCGKEFVKRRGSNSTEGTNSFCSRKCWGAWRTDHKKTEGQSMCKVYFKACVTCGGLFTSKKNNRKYCSSKCSSRFHWGKNKKDRLKKIRDKYREENSIQKIDRVCLWCGNHFKTYYQNKRFCSLSCGKRYRKRHFGNHRRRARSYDVEYEPIDVFFIFDRDGWRCQMCGKKTPKNKRGTNCSNAPELDHIVPMSNGGSHLYSNVQCVCRACNIRKGSSYGVGCQGMLFPEFVEGGKVCA